MSTTFGKIELVKQLAKDGEYVKNADGTYFYQPHQKAGVYFKMSSVAPHVCIKLKNVFEYLRKSLLDSFQFAVRDEICHDLCWFLERYPMEMDKKTRNKLKAGNKRFLEQTRKKESILTEGYAPGAIALNHGFLAREYQIKGAEIFLLQQKMILADYLGLGKSLTATLPIVMQPQKMLPALIVCQTHLPHQWKKDVIEKFTNLTVHIIPVGPVYKLPLADVYIIPYSRIAKWGSVLMHVVKYIVFDEVQELRCKGSDKYSAAQALCDVVDFVQGLSHSPMYNYGIEIWNILDCIKRGCVGDIDDWGRQWGWKSVKDPKALGSYLREQFLMLRRTDKEVGRELPQINTIIKTVEYDESEVEKMDQLTAELALSYYSSTNFAEKGQLAMEFDLRARMETGVAKATSVAALVKLLVESGKSVLLAGWHRRVYEIWLDILKQYNPVMFTGSESPAQKEAAKAAFVSGESKIMIISNRSGVGLDGLQYCCNDVVIGELDWSPKVHEQIIGRVNRDGQQNSVSVYYPICDDGSDPAMVELLGLKSFEAHGIMDPFTDMPEKFTDESRIKKLAESYLLRKNQKGLHKLMQDLIAKEEFERAAEIQKLIDNAQ